MCLIKYYLDASEHWVQLYITANKQNSPELKYACLDYKSKLSREDKKQYKEGLEGTMEPRDGITILNHISVEKASSVYPHIDSFPSLLLDQFEALLIEKGNKAAIVGVPKSYDKTMTKIDIKLGQVISAGEKGNYDVFISNADLFRDFIRAQKVALLLLLDNF